MANLRIRIKQQQQFNSQRQQIHYAGNNPQDLKAFTSPLPGNRQWRNFGSFIDITPDVGDLQKLSLTWTQDRDVNGATTPGATNMKRSASGTLVFEGEAYELLKRWLIDDVSAPLNAVEVELHDTGCDIYFSNYTIRAKDLRYCEGSYCMFEVSLQQKDEVLHCIKSTLITDNHQGWFPEDGKPKTGKLHPRFSYCNEIRPNGQLVALWKLGTWNFMLTNTILLPLILAINSVIFLINGIVAIINAIDAILGTGRKDYIKFIDPKDIIATQEETFIEAAGCGRVHPAPLIRDYIKNVCDKCGIIVDGSSAPIFFNAATAVPFTSTNKTPNRNPHYNACYFYAPVQRGIRRADLPSPFLAPDYNNTDYWIPDNAPLHTLDTFLDELKSLYNADWRIVNNVLYFQRKDYYQSTNHVYNFSANSVDRNKLIDGICYEWNELKYPSYTGGLYTHDATDSCGNEAMKQMNSIVSHGNVDDNPNFESSLNKIHPYGATKFRFDGASSDYIYDAAQVNANSGFLAQSIFGIIGNIMRRLAGYADYALLLRDETAELPKILIWDGVSTDNSRCARPYFAHRTGTMPAPNIPYNNWPTTQPWDTKHPPNFFVKGSNANFNSFPQGYYSVKGIFGSTLATNPAMLVNYPMYFAHDYEDSLWDLFHFIDDPKRNPTMNQNWSLKMPLCCEDIEKLGLKNDAAGIVLGQKLKLPAQYYSDGKIKEITLSYDPTHELGAYIELKGNN